MTEVHGTCDERFTAMRELLAANLESVPISAPRSPSRSTASSVVDLWGGWADTAETCAVGAATRSPTCGRRTKTMMALCALVLVERGELDVVRAGRASTGRSSQPTARTSIEVRHLMSHTSGVSAWAQPVVIDDIFDWEKSTSMLAAQAPWWEPGTASGYHALNQGHLVGEVVRRITGQSLGQFFAEEIAGPLGADFHIGLEPEHDHRVSNVVPPPPLPIDMATLDPDSVMVKTFTGPAPDAIDRLDRSVAAGRDRRRQRPRQRPVGRPPPVDRRLRAARSTASACCRPRRCKLIFDEQTNGIDLVLGAPLRFGIGYGLKHPESYPYLPDGRVCFWGGWGGSVIIVDVDRRMTIAYMMNRMEGGLLGDPRGEGLVVAAYAAVDG